WNFLAKGAGNKDIFIGLSKVSEAVIFLIPFIFRNYTGVYLVKICKKSISPQIWRYCFW
ncbi:MAG: hypothetical protein ACI8XV_002908, partial [Arenicella sp.]